MRSQPILAELPEPAPPEVPGTSGAVALGDGEEAAGAGALGLPVAGVVVPALGAGVVVVVDVPAAPAAPGDGAGATGAGAGAGRSGARSVGRLGSAGSNPAIPLARLPPLVIVGSRFPRPELVVGVTVALVRTAVAT
jgi:hypothetical protein